MVLGGYGLVGAGTYPARSACPAATRSHPLGTAGYSLVGSGFVIVFALGFLVLLARVRRLARIASVRRFELAARDPMSRSPAGAEPAPLLTSGLQFAAVVTAAVVFLGSFAPQITDATEDAPRYHHLQHAAQFLVGALVGAAVASTARGLRAAAQPTWLGIAGVIAAPAVMLLVMLPEIYGSFESNEGLHFLYHVGITALGVVTGLAAGRSVSSRAGSCSCSRSAWR